MGFNSGFKGLKCSFKDAVSLQDYVDCRRQKNEMWIRNIGGMIMARKTQSARRKKKRLKVRKWLPEPWQGPKFLNVKSSDTYKGLTNCSKRRLVLLEIDSLVVSIFTAKFYIFRTMHLRIILVDNKPDAQFLLWYVYLNPLHVSSNYVLILSRTIVLIQHLI